MNSSRRALVNSTLALGLVGALGAGVVVRHQQDTAAPAAPAAVTEAPLVASLAEQPAIPESDFFFRLVELVKREYVEPVEDEQKLAVGSVRGMVGSLADPLATFMGAEEFAAFEKAQQGIYTGIGVELKFVFDQEAVQRVRDGERIRDAASLVPQLVVTAVAPGGPAAQAGLRPGDRIDAVNGRWVLSAAKIEAFRNESRTIRESDRAPAEIDRLLRDMQQRARDGLTPGRARDQILVGESGTVKVAWERAGQVKEADLPKRRTVWPAVARQPDGSLRLALFADAPTQLRAAIGDAREVRLDLRNSPMGNFDVLRPILGVLAPAGDYGAIVGERGRPAQPFAIGTGTTTSRNVTLIVDGTTHGAAEILALALSSRGKAKLSGQAPAGDRTFLAVHRLPDGSGYTLPVGRYQVKAPDPAAPARVSVQTAPRPEARP